MSEVTNETSYQQATQHIGSLIENNATMFEAINYLRDFVGLQCERARTIAAEREAQVVQREREVARGLVEALEGLLKLQDPTGRFAPSWHKPFLAKAVSALSTYNDNRKG